MAIKKYAPENTYKVGEEILHPYWADKGKIVETGKTGGGNDYIVVEFKRLGLKKLVQNTELKNVETI